MKYCPRLKKKFEMGDIEYKNVNFGYNQNDLSYGNNTRKNRKKF